MIQPTTLQFLTELSENNNKPWFDANKPRYLAAKDNFLEFMSDLLVEIRKIEPIYEKDPKKYVDRIYRDIRFSKDKTPYKSSMSGLIERAPEYKKCPFYIHVQPGETFVGGGVWQPEPDLLKKVRQEIDYNGSEFNKIIAKKSFQETFHELTGDALKRPPKGYSEDHPHIDLLKLKQYVVMKKFPDTLVCSDGFIPALVATYTELLPFYYFLDVTMES